MRKKYICFCKTCRKEFKSSKKQTKYCSNKCLPQNISKKEKVICNICGNEIERNYSRLNKYKYHYCSDECKNKGYSKYYSGEKSKKYEKIEVICDYCGEKFSKNKYNLKIHKYHYCSNECKNQSEKHILSGKNHPRYNPNISMEDRINSRRIEGYFKFTKKVYERDSYTCQCCGDDRGGNLNAHHILNYSECKQLRLDINNGITLCEKCHVKFHKTYGYRNNNREQIQEFINKNK